MRGGAMSRPKSRKCYVCGAPHVPTPESLRTMIGAMSASEFCAHCADDARQDVALASLTTQDRIRARLFGGRKGAR